jgi:hypothetical protein
MALSSADRLFFRPAPSFDSQKIKPTKKWWVRQQPGPRKRAFLFQVSNSNKKTTPEVVFLLPVAQGIIKNDRLWCG